MSKKTASYLGLFFVVLVWGTAPLTNKLYLAHYSPSFDVFFGSVASALALLILCRKRLHLLTREYFRVALPLGFFYTAAHLSQRIGLQYTTPTVFSFLENLSCVVVPLLMWLFLKKRPALLQFVGSFVCLCSAAVISGLGVGGLSLGIGEILCALAGILYGVNIAGTGAFAKRFDAALYIMVLLGFEGLLSLIISLVFHFTGVEAIVFSFDPLLLSSRLAIVLISSTLCWVIRTVSMKYVDATAVAVIMPFCSVIAGALSVIFGLDALTPNLVIGAVLGLVAMLICAAGDYMADKKAAETNTKEKTHA